MHQYLKIIIMMNKLKKNNFIFNISITISQMSKSRPRTRKEELSGESDLGKTSYYQIILQQ